MDIPDRGIWRLRITLPGRIGYIHVEIMITYNKNSIGAVLAIALFSYDSSNWFDANQCYHYMLIKKLAPIKKIVDIILDIIYYLDIDWLFEIIMNPLP